MNPIEIMAAMFVGFLVIPVIGACVFLVAGGETAYDLERAIRPGDHTETDIEIERIKTATVNLRVAYLARRLTKLTNGE